VHHLHPSPPARLALYALFAFGLGLQAILAPIHSTAVQVVAVFCLAVSLILAVSALYASLTIPAPLTQDPPPSASTALGAFFVAAWLAPFHYFVFYLALVVLDILVLIPAYVFSASDTWVALLVLVALGGCFLLEYLFLYLLRISAESLPAPLQLPLDK
jgi:hypothetical protein